jgi:hypothetical protein
MQDMKESVGPPMLIKNGLEESDSVPSLEKNKASSALAKGDFMQPGKKKAQAEKKGAAPTSEELKAMKDQIAKLEEEKKKLALAL